MIRCEYLDPHVYYSISTYIYTIRNWFITGSTRNMHIILSYRIQVSKVYNTFICPYIQLDHCMYVFDPYIHLDHCMYVFGPYIHLDHCMYVFGPYIHLDHCMYVFGPYIHLDHCMYVFGPYIHLDHCMYVFGPYIHLDHCMYVFDQCSILEWTPVMLRSPTVKPTGKYCGVV